MSRILRNDNVESNTRKGEGAGLACRRGEEGVSLWPVPGWSFSALIPNSADRGDILRVEKTSETETEAEAEAEAEAEYMEGSSNSCREAL